MTVRSDSADDLIGGDVLALPGRQGGAQRQLGHAQDAVHGRADLVAHVGEELGLGPRGPLGLVAGAAELLLVPLLVGDIGDEADGAALAGGELADPRPSAAGAELVALALVASEVLDPLRHKLLGRQVGVALGRRIDPRPGPDDRFVGRAGDEQVADLGVHGAEAAVADHQPLVGVEHDEPGVEALDGVGELGAGPRQLGLLATAVGHVLGRAEHLDDPPVLAAAEGQLAAPEPAPRAVGVPHPVLGLAHLAVGRAGYRPEVRLDARQVVRVDQRRQEVGAQGEDLLGRAAEDLDDPRVRPGVAPPLQIVDVEDRRHGAGDPLDERAILPGLALGQDPRGDVLDLRDEVERAAGLVAE